MGLGELMAVVSTILQDTALYTLFLDVDDARGYRSVRCVDKPGSPGANRAALVEAALAAIADLNTAEALLVGGGAKWDGLTPAQRTAISIGLVRDMRAVIRLALNLLDSPS